MADTAAGPAVSAAPPAVPTRGEYIMPMARVEAKSDPISVLKLIRRIRERVSRARIVLETLAVDEFEDAANSLELIAHELVNSEAEVERLKAEIARLKSVLQGRHGS